MAAETAPALVLMDIQLPDLDGAETLRRLRSDERTAAIPVLALTAQAMQGDRERFLAAGFDGYLSKPVDVDELIETVRRYCDGGTDERAEQPKLLVVDDIPENVRLLEAVLAPHGYDIVTAADGAEALSRASSRNSRISSCSTSSCPSSTAMRCASAYARTRPLRCCP